MVTTRKQAVDPLVEELPPEKKPLSAAEIWFDIEINPFHAGGELFFRWKIIDHSAKRYIGDFSGQLSPPDELLRSEEFAEESARRYVERIRTIADAKLNAPDAYRIRL